MSEGKERTPTLPAGARKSEEEQRVTSSASRARNKTVLLSPEMTGQVRAMLTDETSPNRSGLAKDPRHRFLPPAQGDLGELDGDTTADPSLLGAGREADSLPSADLPGSVEDGFVRPSFARPGSAFDTLEERGRANPVVRPEVRSGEGSRGFDPVNSLVSPATGRSELSTTQRADSLLEPSGHGLFEHKVGVSYSNDLFSGPAQELQARPNVAPAPSPRAEVARPGSRGVLINPVVASGQQGKLVGLFVSYDRKEEGELFEVRTGRFLITSRPTDTGSYLLIEDASVSALHAIVRATDEGRVQVLDQLSEYGTGITRAEQSEEEEVAGGLVTVGHGDSLRFGKRHFVYVSIPGVNKGKK